MRQRHTPLDMIDHNRLAIQPAVHAGRAVPHMTGRHVSLAQTPHDVGGKHIVDQPGILIGLEQAVIVHHNATAFLPAVL